MQLELSPATLDEIVRALQLKVISGFNPGHAQTAMMDLQTAMQATVKAPGAAE